MTPLEIEILMHYGCKADDYRNGDHSAPAVTDALNRFLNEGLLTHDGFKPECFTNGALKARYAVTPRARFYLEALCQVPLPIQKWVMPGPVHSDIPPTDVREYLRRSSR